MGRYLKRRDYPVYKIPVHAPSIIDNVEGGLNEVKDDKLFYIKSDYDQKENLYKEGEEITEKMKKIMIKALNEMDAPKEQLERVNLKKGEG